MTSRNLLPCFLVFISSVVLAQTHYDEPELLSASEPSSVRVSINKKYIEICEAELGAFPSATINCPDATLIPTERTLPDSTVKRLTESDLADAIPRFRGEEFGQLHLNNSTRLFDDIITCDKPSGIFRDMRNAGCVPGNRIKHVTNKIKANQIVDWVYICRKNTNYPQQHDLYNELGLIGYNRSTGKTCFFAGQPTKTLKVKGKWEVNGAIKESVDVSLIDGNLIPSPKSSHFNKDVALHWSLPTFGGCTRCHSNGPFIRYPFNEPVCLVKSNSEKCVKSFSNNEQCNAHMKNEIQKIDRLNYKCQVLKPKRQPGMLYSVVSPFEMSSELYKFISTMQPTAKKDSYYKELMDTPWSNPKRLIEKDAAACMQCHDIGNEDYARLFVNSLFSIHLDNQNGFKPFDNEHWRTRLFLSNVTEAHRINSYHDNKLVNEGLLPIEITTVSIEAENEQRRLLSLEYYKKALHTINGCAASGNNCKWDEPWTLERVKTEPLKYLQERCSFCHAPQMALPVLVDEADFKKSAVINRIKARLYETVTPMPPSGQLPDSVLVVITDYLNR